MPVRFWDRNLDQVDRSNPHRGPAAHGWDPESAPDAERARLPEDFNALRDELLTGEDIYSPEWPAPVRHPSKTVLQNLAAASYPAAATGTPGLEPIRRASHGTRPSSARPVAPSSNEQPGRGNDRAA